MRRALILLLCLALQSEVSAKGKLCFTKAEENAEQLVRGGLRLREGAVGCDDTPWRAGTLPLWQQVDKQFGTRFKQQTDIRRKAFEREFAKDAENRVQAWDGRIVLHYRNYPLSVAYCTELKQTLQTLLKKGWGSFVAQASKAKDEVEMDYRPCP